MTLYEDREIIMFFQEYMLSFILLLVFSRLFRLKVASVVTQQQTNNQDRNLAEEYYWIRKIITQSSFNVGIHIEFSVSSARFVSMSNHCTGIILLQQNQSKQNKHVYTQRRNRQLLNIAGNGHRPEKQCSTREKNNWKAYGTVFENFKAPYSW